MIYLKTSCCGYTLKKSTQIVGLVSLIAHAIILISTIVAVILWPPEKARNSIDYSKNYYKRIPRYNIFPSDETRNSLIRRKKDLRVDNYFSNIDIDKLLKKLNYSEDTTNRFRNLFNEYKNPRNNGKSSNVKSYEEPARPMEHDVHIQNKNDSLDQPPMSGRQLVLIIVSCMGIMFSGMLLDGATTGTTSVIFPWIFLTCFGLILKILVGIHAVIKIFHLFWHGESVTGEIIFEVSFSFPLFCLEFYGFLIVFSYYQELKLAKMGEQANLIPMHPSSDPVNSSYSSTVDTEPKDPEK